MRADASAYRYGGEELAIVFPRATLKEAAVVARRILKRIEAARFTSDDKQLMLTASAGVAELSDGMSDPDALIAAADGALYAAKDAGRNCLRVAGEDRGKARVRK